MATNFFDYVKEVRKSNQILDEALTDYEETRELVNKLVKKRQDLKMTQRELALKSGLEQPAIARLESMNSIPRLDTFLRVAKALNLNFDLHNSAEYNVKYLVVPIIDVKMESNESRKYSNTLFGGDKYGTEAHENEC